MWAPVVGGWGTGGAFLIAAVGYVYNRSKDRRDREVEQARLFSAWVADVTPREDSPQHFDLAVDFWNGNPHALTQVLVSPSYQTSDGVLWGELRGAGLIPPTISTPHRVTLDVDLPDDITVPEGTDLCWAFFLADIGFADTAGQWWRRGSDGRLEKTSWDSPRGLRRLARRRYSFKT